MRRVLTWQTACEIRSKWNSGMTMKAVASEVGVSLAHVSRICNNKVWRTEKYGSLTYFCRRCGETKKSKMVSSKTCKRCKADRNNASRRKALKVKRTKMLSELGDACELCSVKLTAEKSNWTRHHLSYEPEILVMVCRACHHWLHGAGQVYPNHPIKQEFNKGIAPYEFSKRVVALYERKLREEAK